MNGLEPMQFRGVDGTASLREVLTDLKEQGCSLLIAGEVPAGLSRLQSRRLFGVPEADRKRVLALTKPTGVPPRDWLPDGVSPSDGDVRVLDFGGASRSAAADGNQPATPELTRIRREIAGEVIDLVGSAGTLEPSELRLGLYSLDVLLARHQRSAVKRTLRGLTELVTAQAGMAHFHLPASRDSPLVGELESLFDAVVLLRNEEYPEHKWVIPEWSETAWHPFR